MITVFRVPLQVRLVVGDERKNLSADEQRPDSR